VTLLHRSPPDTAPPDPGLFVRRARAEAAGFALSLAMLRLSLALRAWNPNQPRVPAGNPDGGEWTTIGFGWARAGGEKEPRIRVAQVVSRGRRGSGFSVSDGRREFEVSIPQGTRIALREAQVAAVERQITAIRPRWRPEVGAWENADGYEVHLEARLLSAEAELQRLSLLSGGFIPNRPPIGRMTECTEELIFPGGKLIGWREPARQRGFAR
jgi:hypothetical protein